MTMEIRAFSELTFEEKTHTYTLNGIAIPSVTTVMKPLSDDTYGSIDKEVLNRAAARGTAVHNAIENYLNFGVEDISSEYRGYFEGFLRWMQEHDVKPIGTEIRLYHKGLLYAGTTDLVAEVDGKITLVDYKTSASVQDKLCGVQLEAYDKALHSHGYTVEQRAILHLKKDGEHTFIPFAANSEYWRVFTALLTVQNYKKKLKGGK